MMMQSGGKRMKRANLRRSEEEVADCGREEARNKDFFFVGGSRPGLCMSRALGNPRLGTPYPILTSVPKCNKITSM